MNPTNEDIAHSEYPHLISLATMSPLLFQTPYFPLFTSLLILIIFWKKSKARSGPSKSPPGPWKLPIIGNLHQLAAGNPLPHHALRDLAKKHGPIMHLKLGQLEAIIISSSTAAQEVLKTHELSFAQRPLVLAAEVMSFGQASIVFAPYGDLWRQLRKLCVFELLSPKRVQSFRSIREEEVMNLIESISTSSKGTPINLSERISSLTNGIVSRAMFGKKCKDEKEFTSLLDEAITRAAGFEIPDLFPSLRFIGFITGTIPALKKMSNRLGKILESIINDHKIKTQGNEFDKSEEDIVDVLLKLQESNKELEFTTDHIKDVIMDIFSAGSETTSTTIEWAMSELMRNPRVMNTAQVELRKLLKGKPKIEEADLENLEYLKAVVKETLRLHPAGPLLPRETRERCEISGYEFPAKTKVIINQWAIGRDPESWGVDAESFKPERFMRNGSKSNVDYKGFDFEFLPFGAGRRICPGISFAVSIIELVLSQLLYHFDWELENRIKPDELDMSEAFGITCRRRHDLYAILTPHRFPALK